MKNIVAINTANAGGGAEKVSYGLCKDLHVRGYNSMMLARRIDYTADPLAQELVVPVPGSDLMYSAGNFLDKMFSTHSLFYLPTRNVPSMAIVRQADVIHMHNMHGYYFNLWTIPKLMVLKPVVWTFHDMWPFTGKCVHAYDCGRYTSACGNCPQLSAYPKLTHDTSRMQLKLKKRLFQKKNFMIVSPSEWLRGHIGKSFLRDHPVRVIPSPVDTKIFYPEHKRTAREKMQIPNDKKVMLFIASWVNSIPSKGIRTFKALLKALYAQRSDLYTIVIGNLENKTVLGDQFAGKETGWIGNANDLRMYYSAADILVSPTLAENSSCTIVEAMACGTVPVAFAVGGVPEQISRGETGLLIPPKNTQELIQAVDAVLNRDDRRDAMAKAAAETVRAKYSMDKFIEKHLEVYDEAIRRHG